jgi:Sel1 repeat
MKTYALALSLLLVSTLSLADNDIWTALFKTKLNEATDGDSAAQYDVGTMYQNGRGVAADRNKAVEWYRKAAAQNYASAVSRLKLMDENAVRFKKTQALAAKGDSESQYDLGNMYLMGVGSDIDYNSAIQAFEQSANTGNDKAAYKLGLIYYEGTGVRGNPATAFNWFSMAAEHNFPAAQYYLGKMYGEGAGTRRNNTLALQWLNKAVDGGFEQARGEMINVTENINMEKAATRAAAARPAPEPEPVATAKPSADVAQESASRKAPARNTGKNAPAKAAAKTREYSIEDLMQGAWNRGNEPVAYLPSIINNCRTEDGKVVCFSEDQTSTSGNNVIRFKTKAIIDSFSRQGSFSVTYRNLVIEASPLAGKDISGIDGDETESYPVKTGWGSPHTLECKFSSTDTLSCLKNNTYAIKLTSPRTLASGK